MKRIISITAVISFILTGCASDPIANFAYSPANPIAGEEIIFENLSVDAESFEWNFGDGTSAMNYDAVHAFSAGGTFTVQLKAFGKRSGMDVASATIQVVSIIPTANFGIYTDLPVNDGPKAYETDVVFIGEQVEFYNTSIDGVSFLWNFGDGYVSELESPVYSYDTPGDYVVTLTAYGLAGEQHSISKPIYVYEGVNSLLRITVLDVEEDYLPIADASVILYPTYDDWYNYTNALEEVFTSQLGKCVYEDLNAQRYYVDAWVNDKYNNSGLGIADAAWVETQVLEENYIHDFFAYIEFTGSKKSLAFEKRGEKRINVDEARAKKLQLLREGKINKFSQAR